MAPGNVQSDRRTAPDRPAADRVRSDCAGHPARVTGLQVSRQRVDPGGEESEHDVFEVSGTERGTGCRDDARRHLNQVIRCRTDGGSVWNLFSPDRVWDQSARHAEPDSLREGRREGPACTAGSAASGVGCAERGVGRLCRAGGGRTGRGGGTSAVQPGRRGGLRVHRRNARFGQGLGNPLLRHQRQARTAARHPRRAGRARPGAGCAGGTTPAGRSCRGPSLRGHQCGSRSRPARLHEPH